MKKIVLLIFILIISLGCEKKDNMVNIVTTNFPSYDFIRAIIKDSPLSVSMLIEPGSDIHEVDLTPQDMIKIHNSQLFVYTGGDSDSWVDNVLKNVNKEKTKVVKLMDLVELKKEETRNGEEDKSDEDDEHVWTSLLNTMTIINKLKEQVIRLDEKNKDLYERNANNYLSEIQKLHLEIQDIVKHSPKKVLVLGDRFPFRYFMDDYKLSYYAAFKGCSNENEASAKTLSFLINKIKENNLSVVLKIELSNGTIANTISKETNTKVLELHSGHNISKKDYDNHITYVDIIKRNINVLKEALN